MAHSGDSGKTECAYPVVRIIHFAPKTKLSLSSVMIALIRSRLFSFASSASASPGACIIRMSKRSSPTKRVLHHENNIQRLG